ncbi:MAG: 50S ribosomal protein L5 [Candidatus Schekmanbacteria bacterium RIFCSPHIGHO2_02_FULL_38_11]|uniref:Large ribosomal subunit protein uL5 n=1 Tax=Candidatus Schekmanbacteria bacterium RIFCSPLOWO2_12_FULL_38_15 TaxID=1817883 RepID=A0A1F7SLL0_9BACT|nr:ribosomal protein L5 [uncultured bacterium]OGL39165.1 MAG: 50S ribosomal protein L5 [Candidatus Schekmanbacteria bacterium GWA2_38_9]OGL50073.1 MAG: 50S ribosomal protein L5 [Candidatus Schekmanbacteria bacterium RIFCSPLOWO2_02_FULL_38_14]OGL50515.1 MAG: 50S ribosomal protein L5 [Candidatus Schekmanbacteria bacterium RIFCSPHIGHO2_02_FULL_38_11]OGL54672.1 MAG: 50S ribosomal protein L5 [Candidatus Schekmanbacteria bacterium RIFCSPLOWO2_12_FULL_38_15]
MAVLKEKYKKEIVKKMMKDFGYKNIMEVPRLAKIIINMGLGEAIQNAKAVDAATGELTAISGQKPIVTKAKKSIATFKLREGMSIGCKVTLRGKRMYEFFDRLVNASLPRIRDFKGISGRSFDGRGNFTFGLKEQIIFPEIDYDKIDKLRGMNITIATTAMNDEEGKALLKYLGMPFRN